MRRRAVLGLGATALAVGGLTWLGRSQAPEPGGPPPRRLPYGRHPRQVGDLYLPRSAVGVVVMLHGGFWRAGYDLGLQDDVAADLAGRGWVVWNLDYRPLGDGGGWPGTFDDVRAGVTHLADLELPELPGGAAEPVLLGHSAGGHLAVWAAGADTGAVRVRAAISMAGVLDLTAAARQGLGGGVVADLMGGAPEQVPRRYAEGDPARRLPLGVPVRAVHGRDDTVVPLSQSSAYVEAATAAGDDAVLIETDGGHFDALDPASRMWRRTLGALDAL